MIQHLLHGPLGKRTCRRCGWSERHTPEPCRRPRVEPGMVFGKLVVKRLAGAEEWGKYKTGRQKGQPKMGSKIWACVCSCGNATTVPTHRLTTGVTRSCGCMRKKSAMGKRGTQYDRRQRKWRHAKSGNTT